MCSISQSKLTKASVKIGEPVSISVRDIPIEKFLEELFKAQPLLKYTIEGKDILVSPKKSSFSEYRWNYS